MGYYTRFEIITNQRIDGVKTDLENISGYNFSGSNDMMYSDDIKWYTHVDDMKALSLKYKGVVFTVSGVGEGDGEEIDQWKQQYLSGELIASQYASIVWSDWKRENH